MKSIIAACGNDCSACPRLMPKTEYELINTAVLWKKIGYRDSVVKPDDIQCFGCSVNNYCRYGIIECAVNKGVKNCGFCDEYPCEKISAAFKKTAEFEPALKACCNKKEYESLKKAFFNKKENLDFFCK